MISKFAAGLLAGEDTGIPELDANIVVGNSFDLVFYLLGGIAVIVIIVSGIMYITSVGDSGRVTKAKNMLTYAIVGLVVVVIAGIVVNFVTSRF